GAFCCRQFLQRERWRFPAYLCWAMPCGCAALNRRLDPGAARRSLMDANEGDLFMHSHTDKANDCGCHDRGAQAPCSNESGAIPNVAMRVEGMDCASCVGKIETALARIPGVSDISLNFATQKLELRLAPSSSVQAGDIEKTIRRLGFGVSTDKSDTGTTGTHAHAPAVRDGERWWQTRRGKQVVWLGILMSAAYAMSLFFPSYGSWVFAGAVIV